MADHLTASIPLDSIRRIQLYINTARKSLADIQRETGADYILNGTLYNMRTFAPVCHLKADGAVLCRPAYSVAGYAWQTGPDISLDTLPDDGQANYIACTPLIVSGAPVSRLTYDPGQGGSRGRSAIGIKGGCLVLYCSKDSAGATPERLRDALHADGWESAIMLDGGGSCQCDFAGERIASSRRVHDLILVYTDKEGPMGVKTYSLKRDGNKRLSANFRVREFRCRDGSDKILVSTELVELLQRIRDHFGAAVTINSAYRTAAHNAQVGGAPRSQHMQGTAADIVVSGATPLEVAQYVEHLQPDRGGIGVYKSFTHVDVRAGRARWDNRSGKEVAVSGWPGYQPEPTDEEQALAWAKANGIMTGYADGEMHLDDPVTRRQLLLVAYRMSKL